MAMVPVTHQVKTKTGYQGTKEVIRPKTIMVTELAQMAIFLPYLSDTSPEQKDPRAKPVKSLKEKDRELVSQCRSYSILASVLSQLLSHTRSHSVTMVDTQKLWSNS